jgi:hypothetical protein
MAFLGIDARTEVRRPNNKGGPDSFADNEQRTRHQINYPETYDEIFRRLNDELKAAKDSGTAINHLILLLGIPIAYPVRTQQGPPRNSELTRSSV